MTAEQFWFDGHICKQHKNACCDECMQHVARADAHAAAQLAEKEREIAAGEQFGGKILAECQDLRERLRQREAELEQRWIAVEEKEPPKDGSEVLLLVKYRAGIPNGKLVGHWQPGGHCIQDHPPIEAGWYFWNGRMFDQASEPTHWQPLPSP